MKWCWLIVACEGLFFGLWKKLSLMSEIYLILTGLVELFNNGMIIAVSSYTFQYNTSGLCVGFINMLYMRRYYLIWEKFNENVPKFYYLQVLLTLSFSALM